MVKKASTNKTKTIVENKLKASHYGHTTYKHLFVHFLNKALDFSSGHGDVADKHHNLEEKHE